MSDWRPIPGFEAYSISRSGTVRSRKGCLLKPLRRKRTGHLYLTLVNPRTGKNTVRQIHNLLLWAWVGPPPFSGAMALHRDGDVNNNDLGNLYWGDAQSNADDRDRHGTTQRGERHAKHKLTEAQVLAIRASEAGTAALAREYGLQQCTVSNIRAGRIWKHLLPEGGVTKAMDLG